MIQTSYLQSVRLRSGQKGQSTEKLGIHCHFQVFEAVEADAGATSEHREKAVAAKDSRDYQRHREWIFKLFPKIPEESASNVLDHGFLEESGRVGGAAKFDEKLRVTLAVNAHIRHKLTTYDSILGDSLGSGPREYAKRAARDQVHDQVEAIADSWREDSKGGPKDNSRKSGTRLFSAAKNSAATLEDNRSRRKAQAKQRLTEDGREEKAIEEILKLLKLDDSADDTRTTLADREEKGLELALKSLDLDEDSALPLTRYQRRRAAIREDLLKIKRDPNHPMINKRLAQVLKMHRNDGENVTSLGSAAVARIDAQVTTTLGDRATTKAQRSAAREMQKLKKSNDEKTIRAKSKRERRKQHNLDLLQQFERNPNMSVTPRQKRRIIHLQKEREKERRPEAERKKYAVIVRGKDGALTFAPRNKSKSGLVEPEELDAGCDVSHVTSGHATAIVKDEQEGEVEGGRSYQNLGDKFVSRIKGDPETRSAHEGSEWMEISG